MNKMGYLGDPCTKLLCDGDIETTQHVIGIEVDLYNNNIIDFSSIDVSVFSKLESIVLGGSVIPPNKLLSKISKLSNLKTLSIYNLIYSEQVLLPKSITTLKFQNFKGTYYSEWVNSNITNLRLYNVQDFKLKGSFKKNQVMKAFEFPVPPNGFQVDLDLMFPNVMAIEIYMKEVDSDDYYAPSKYLGSFYSFNKLESLKFTFSSNDTNKSLKKPIYFPILSYLKSLNYLLIEGDSLIFYDGQFIDLNNSINNLKIEIKNSKNLLTQSCKKCFRVPFNTTCNFDTVNLIADKLDFTNCASLTFNNIGPNQKMLFKGFNFNNLKTLNIFNSLFYGNISDNICKIDYNSIQIQNNLFDNPPSCYLCTNNIDIRKKILPNQFINFDQNTPVSCPKFRVDKEDLYLVDTAGGSIYISGYDLGFEISVPNGEIYEFEVLNERIRFDINQLFGNGANIRSISVTFLNNINVDINYRYISPTITSYYYDSSSTGTINLVGKGFSYLESSYNVLIVNGDIGPMNIQAKLDYAPHLIVKNNTRLLLTEDQEFTVNLDVVGQQFEGSFIFSKENIEILTKDITLTSNGTTLTIYGKFLTNDISKVNLTVSNINCLVSQFSQDSLTFTYPGSISNIGYQNLDLIINYKFYRTIVNIIEIKKSNVLPSESSSSSSSEDFISFSIKLFSNSILIIILITLIII